MVKKYLGSPVFDDYSRDQVNKNTRLIKISLISDSFDLTDTASAGSVITDQDGNPFTLSRGHVITDAGFFVTTAVVAGSCALSLGITDSSSGAVIISGITTDTSTGLLYAALSDSASGLPYAITADGTSLFAYNTVTTPATAGAGKFYIEVHSIDI